MIFNFLHCFLISKDYRPAWTAGLRFFTRTKQIIRLDHGRPSTFLMHGRYNVLLLFKKTTISLSDQENMIFEKLYANYTLCTLNTLLLVFFSLDFIILGLLGLLREPI